MKSRKIYSFLVGAVVVIIFLFWLKNKSETNETTSINMTDVLQTGLEDKVKVTVIYETLCPDSMAFVSDQLWPTFQKLSPIMSLELVPWGKASYRPQGNTWSFICQHGERECFGNRIHACVLDETRHDLSKGLEFVYCSMSSRDPVSGSQQCVNKLGLNWDRISACANGLQGNDLLHTNGVFTERQNPPLVFVPWILINNKFTKPQLERSLENLFGVVCDSYKGPRQDVCQQL